MGFGYMVGVGLMGASSGAYFNGIAANMTGHDITTGIYKALVFGVLVMWVCCYKGYNAERRAAGSRLRHHRSRRPVHRPDSCFRRFFLRSS